VQTAVIKMSVASTWEACYINETPWGGGEVKFPHVLFYTC